MKLRIPTLHASGRQMGTDDQAEGGEGLNELGRGTGRGVDEHGGGGDPAATDPVRALCDTSSKKCHKATKAWGCMAAAPMLTVIDTPLVESKVPLPRVACHCHVPLVAMYVYNISGPRVRLKWKVCAIASSHDLAPFRRGLTLTR